MQSLVNDGLVEGLEERNSTLLMWLSIKGNGGTPAQEVYEYFTTYFSDGYGGYYAEGEPSDYMDYAWKMMLGIINLKTGTLMAFDNNIEVTVEDLFYYADLANE
jgi:hypothetical protein